MCKLSSVEQIIDKCVTISGTLSFAMFAQNELLRILYPVFLHSYMDLVAKGFPQEGDNLSTTLSKARAILLLVKCYSFACKMLIMMISCSYMHCIQGLQVVV